MAAGFVLTSANSGLNSFQDALFGSGVLLWIVGAFGATYCIARRLAGSNAAELAVVAVFLILVSELFSGKRGEKNHDSFEHALPK